VWKYLFKISPSDVIKFDSTEFFVVPNNWSTTTDSDIQIIRDGGNSDNNNNQIKTVYIENGGDGYQDDTFSADIVGDGTGGRVSIETTNNKITKVTVITGGKGYTYGAIDLSGQSGSGSKLIPIIPPSKGHGHDIYTELGTDKVLLYARFDDSTKDFPIDTKFAQVGILKNPETFGGGTTFNENQFSSLFAIKLTSQISISIGTEISQTVTSGAGVTTIAKGYVASYDKETNVLKYYQDRSLCFGNEVDQTDSNDTAAIVGFSTAVTALSPAGTIDTSFNGSVVTINSKQINLGVNFTNGLADPEINKKTGDIIYIDNRPTVQRDSRQKEDVKIILEF
jgi:hypothetical protein